VIERAFAEIQARKEELAAAESRAIEAAIAQYRLAYDAAGAARWIEQRIIARQGRISAKALFAEIEPLYDLALQRGLRLEAEMAYCLARRAVDLASDGPDQGAAMVWLGIVANEQGARLGGAEGAARLEEAVTAYRAALRVYTEAELPAQWAGTQNNLGNALSTQGERLGGAAGVARLEEAVTAYRAALRVRTEAELPTDWAMTQNNLGAALQTQGERLGGAEGLARLEEAVTAYRAALRVRTEAELPADWAMTRENMAIAFESLADAEPVRALQHLREAEAAVLDALRVYTPTEMPYHHDKATALLTHIRERLGT
jgi:tetratricopeptide (TPR) repeat protein